MNMTKKEAVYTWMYFGSLLEIDLLHIFLIETCQFVL